MATNTDRPVGPGTWSRDGYSVTIAADGKIRVKKDDWLSKYSRCLYGNYDTLDVFVRPAPPLYAPVQEIKGIKAIENVDLIKTNEFLVHVPTYRHWTKKRGKPLPPTPPKEGVDPPKDGVDPSRLEDFLRFVKKWFCPVNDLKFSGSSGIDLSAGIFSGHYCRIDVQRENQPPPPTRFHAFGAGLNWGPEAVAGSVTITPSDFPCYGWVGKSVLVGGTLGLDEVCGDYLVVDFSGGEVFGLSVAFLFFGFNTPPHAILRNVVGWFRGVQRSWPILPSLCHGVVFMLGANLTTPQLGVSCKVGVMHRVECVTG